MVIGHHVWALLGVERRRSAGYKYPENGVMKAGQDELLLVATESHLNVLSKNAG